MYAMLVCWFDCLLSLGEIQDADILRPINPLEGLRCIVHCFLLNAYNQSRIDVWSEWKLFDSCLHLFNELCMCACVGVLLRET